MATLQDIREIVLALPEVEAASHFHLPSFKVSGKNFIGIQNDGVHVTFAMSEQQAHELLEQWPALFEEIRRFDTLIGIRADLPQMSVELLRQVVNLSWRSKAP